LNGILGPIAPVILAYLVFGGVLLAVYSKLLNRVKPPMAKGGSVIELGKTA
jgi:hypothetical protein